MGGGAAEGEGGDGGGASGAADAAEMKGQGDAEKNDTCIKEEIKEVAVQPLQR